MINSFTGEYDFLSNFYLVEVRYAGAGYPSVEHAFQAAKCANPSERRMFRSGITAGQAKRLGRKVELRKDWERAKLSVMESLVRQKFEVYQDLAKKLLDTGEQEIIEGNNWGDVFWGICDGRGQNHLGKILMKIRKEVAMIVA